MHVVARRAWRGPASGTSWVARISRSSRYWTRCRLLLVYRPNHEGCRIRWRWAFALFDETITGRLRGKEPRATVEAVRMGKKKMFASSAKGRARSGIPNCAGVCGAAIRHRLVSRTRVRACHMSYRIGIIAALAGELKPLVRGWSRHANGAFLTQRGDVAAIAVAMGMGGARAEQAVAIAETHGPLDALASIGWAGGASCGIQPGTAYEVGEVIDAASGERYAASTTASPIKLADAGSRCRTGRKTPCRREVWCVVGGHGGGGGRPTGTSQRHSFLLLEDGHRYCHRGPAGFYFFWTRRSSCAPGGWPHTL